MNGSSTPNEPPPTSRSGCLLEVSGDEVTAGIQQDPPAELPHAAMLATCS